jgi:hypothetical protein
MTRGAHPLRLGAVVVGPRGTRQLRGTSGTSLGSQGPRHPGSICRVFALVSGTFASQMRGVFAAVATPKWSEVARASRPIPLECERPSAGGDAPAADDEQAPRESITRSCFRVVGTAATASLADYRFRRVRGTQAR